jgi:hypothetical protein
MSGLPTPQGSYQFIHGPIQLVGGGALGDALNLGDVLS